MIKNFKILIVLSNWFHELKALSSNFWSACWVFSSSEDAAGFWVEKAYLLLDEVLIAVHSLQHYTKILFHKEAFSFLSFPTFQNWLSFMLEKLNKRRDDWKTNTAFTKTKAFKTGARLRRQYCSSWHQVWMPLLSVAPPSSSAPSPTLPILLMQYFSTSAPHCTSLSATFLSQSGSCIMRGLVRPGLGLGGERCPAETSIYPAHCRLRSPKSMGTAAYNGQSTKELLS